MQKIDQYGINGYILRLSGYSGGQEEEFLRAGVVGYFINLSRYYQIAIMVSIKQNFTMIHLLYINMFTKNKRSRKTMKNQKKWKYVPTMYNLSEIKGKRSAKLYKFKVQDLWSLYSHQYIADLLNDKPLDIQFLQLIHSQAIPYFKIP